MRARAVSGRDEGFHRPDARVSPAVDEHQIFFFIGVGAVATGSDDDLPERLDRIEGHRSRFFTISTFIAANALNTRASESVQRDATTD